MHSITIALAIIVALCLIHFGYMDFRFRHRGSILWFWLAEPAPILLWVSRAAIIACVVVAVATVFVGLGAAAAILLGVLLLIHVVTAIIMEVREERPPPPNLPHE
jgi:hypothetical protein